MSAKLNSDDSDKRPTGEKAAVKSKFKYKSYRERRGEPLTLQLTVSASTRLRPRVSQRKQQLKPEQNEKQTFPILGASVKQPSA